MLRIISTVVATRAQSSLCQVLDRALGRLAWHTAARVIPAWMRTMPPHVGTGGRWWGLPFAAALRADISAASNSPESWGTVPATAPPAPPASAPPAQSCGAQASAPCSGPYHWEASSCASATGQGGDSPRSHRWDRAGLH